MGILGEWQASRERRRRAERYLRDVLDTSDATESEWLVRAGVARAVADRELLYARRALGLIVAERDALDDQTASDVTHALAPLLDAESRTAHGTPSPWTARWRAYSTAMTVRGLTETPATRLARVLLDGAGVATPSPDLLGEATQYVQSARVRANEVLRTVFGVASLPDDVAPSAMRH